VNFPAGRIDVHTHAIDPDLPDLNGQFDGVYPTVRRLDDDRAQIMLDGKLYRDIDSRCWSPEARIRDMDAEGVAVQVLSPIPVTLSHSEPAPGATALARSQNDFLAALVASAPDRLLAFACVPLQDVGLAIAELERCLDLGFVGVEIGTRVGDRELADEEFLPFFQAAAARGATVFLHPVDRTLDPRLGRLKIAFGMGMPTETATTAAGLLVAGIVDKVPGLRLCLAHAGGALPALLPRVSLGQRIVQGVDDPAATALVQASALWSDSLTYDLDSLLLAVARFGSDHIVLGTDYPFTAKETPAGAVLTGSDPRLGTAARNAMGRDNALALFAGLARAAAVPTHR
jgi:aminocarboxymuconate-semialdehyde decarboxylase